MKCASFLRAIWPREGYYCLAIQTDRGPRHYWYEDIDEAAAAALSFDAKCDIVYHACASFKTTENRKSINAHSVRSLWIDIDVGDGENKYATRVDAALALRDFINAIDAPTPWIISSGGGLHVYWPLTNDGIPVETARPIAKTLKRLAVHHGFKIDPTRTGDMSSVLRPVGTHNRKTSPPIPVEALTPLETTTWKDLAGAIAKAAMVLPVLTPADGKRRSINAQFLVQPDYPPADANQVADKCAQLGAVRATKGNVSEPVWYSSIELLYHCVDGEKVIHEWSQGHPHYSPEQTDAKIKQIKDLGPTTCATFESRNPAGCAACPHRGGITSPIQLGAVFRDVTERPGKPAEPEQRIFPVEDDALSSDEYVEPPDRFGRTEQGVVFYDDNGVPTLCYQFDMVVHEIAFDDAAKHEVTTVRHHLPHEGWMEFSFRSAAVASDKDFETAMRDNHVKPANTKLLRAYVMAYMLKLQEAKRMRRLYSQMGWKDDTSYFVLGEKAFHANGRVEPVGISPSIKAVASGLRTRGELAVWAAATGLFAKPGMEAHALLFAAGAGAPLMRFTGFEGALFNAVGRSNAGKTSMARFFMSMYGDFNRLKLKQRDTENAKVQRIGALSSLPVYVDEITNEDPQAVSDFVYEVTQGRSKLRLRQDGSERETLEWHTIVVSSANTPLAGKLGIAKANPEAERLRLFEFRVGREASFDDRTAAELFRICTDNYGHAGERYIQHVVTQQEKVKAGLLAFIEQLKVACEARPEERMWMASLGCALYGLKLLADLDLFRAPVKPIVAWAIATVRAARTTLEAERYNPTDILGHYLNAHASSRLSLRETGVRTRGGDIDYLVERYPSHEVRMRFDITHGVMWVDSRHFQRWLVEHYEDFHDVVDRLNTAKIIRRKTRMALGRGTGLGTSAVECLEIDMNASVLGNQLAALVKSEQAGKKEAA